MNLDVLSGGDNLRLSLYNGRASCYKSCKLLFSTSEIVPAKNRKEFKTNDDRDQGDSSQKSSQKYLKVSLSLSEC